jgi:hypothetical protein
VFTGCVGKDPAAALPLQFLAAAAAAAVSAAAVVTAVVLLIVGTREPSLL